jgi:hypothetical protein
MKKAIFICLVIFISCKKKKDPEPEPVAPAPVEKQVSVKINNETFSCTACANTYFSGGMHGVNIAESGTSNRMVFNFDTVPKVGTHNLVKFGKTSLTYEKNGRYYRGRGVLNISAISTGTSGSINLFTATFDALTDTASDNTHFSLKEGSLNLKFK